MTPGVGGAETYETQITGTGPAKRNTFGYPTGVAVDEATGDVYVVDAGNDTIDVFKRPEGGKYEYPAKDHAAAWEQFRRRARMASLSIRWKETSVTELLGPEVDQFTAAGSFVDAFSLTTAGHQLLGTRGRRRRPGR